MVCISFRFLPITLRISGRPRGEGDDGVRVNAFPISSNSTTACGIHRQSLVCETHVVHGGPDQLLFKKGPKSLGAWGTRYRKLSVETITVAEYRMHGQKLEGSIVEDFMAKDNGWEGRCSL